MTEPDRDDPQSESFSQGLVKEFRQEARSALRWARNGAIVGAVVLGGIGLWYFGLVGLGIGAGIGAVVGGVGAFLLYSDASTGF
jgi:hypothetical protein